MKIIQHRSMILSNIKCPQLSKPKAKATVARSQKSIRDRLDKKTLGENRLSRGPVLLWPMKEQCDSGSITKQIGSKH